MAEKNSENRKNRPGPPGHTMEDLGKMRQMLHDFWPFRAIGLALDGIERVGSLIDRGRLVVDGLRSKKQRQYPQASTDEPDPVYPRPGVTLLDLIRGVSSPSRPSMQELEIEVDLELSRTPVPAISELQKEIDETVAMVHNQSEPTDSGDSKKEPTE